MTAVEVRGHLYCHVIRRLGKDGACQREEDGGCGLEGRWEVWGGIMHEANLDE